MKYQRDPLLWKAICFHADNMEAFKLKKLWTYLRYKHEQENEEQIERFKNYQEEIKELIKE
jgi:hypothetical protein